jgi:type II secretory ATPase GspE/PulE/Tfp pilus assembly ATPase PilB-like protein
MGVEPFLISSTMIASIAQRLVRRVCRHCGAPHEPDTEVLRHEFGIGPEQMEGGTFKMGAGCDECRHTGYRGRLAVYEMLAFTEQIKQMTVQRANALDIKKVAVRSGMKTLRGSGWQRIYSGDTTLEEVLRVTADSESIGFELDSGHAPVSV